MQTVVLLVAFAQHEIMNLIVKYIHVAPSCRLDY